MGILHSQGQLDYGLGATRYSASELNHNGATQKLTQKCNIADALAVEGRLIFVDLVDASVVTGALVRVVRNWAREMPWTA
eukprot:CAMPEP_0172763664 /NCGR_PEP_ID=MMETSP1074-20121228/175789_1 /TAXON_ID=2916 /ORGANISM="Ceratium fusus, Strain PA161109" /LENGTH=79 /DNA_ID=CAMNT_0013598291 /DNA_START=129 /DNA_END=366 /DNA_ORIENTATION=+